jgi:hypothetical protein
MEKEGQCKGFAFVEFEEEVHIELLRLHPSQLMHVSDQRSCCTQCEQSRAQGSPHRCDDCRCSTQSQAVWVTVRVITACRLT